MFQELAWISSKCQSSMRVTGKLIEKKLSLDDHKIPYDTKYNYLV